MQPLDLIGRDGARNRVPARVGYSAVGANRVTVRIHGTRPIRDDELVLGFEFGTALVRVHARFLG
jgi:hypothetical protein